MAILGIFAFIAMLSFVFLAVKYSVFFLVLVVGFAVEYVAIIHKEDSNE